MRVTAIGLGEMGSALANAFIESGQSVTVWNRTTSKAEPLVAKGAHLAAHPVDAVGAAELIVVNVKSGAAVIEIIRSAGTALAGRTIVDLTDGPTADVEASAQVAAEFGADYLHGQILTIAPAIGSPDAVIFYGGATEVFDRHESLLRMLGGRTVHVSEEPSTCALYGMAVNDVMWGLLNGFLHAAALLRSAGVSIAQFDQQAAPALSALPAVFAVLADEIDRGEYATPYGAMKHHMPAIDDVIAESRRRGADTEFPTYTRSLVAASLAAGHGDDSYARLIDRFGRALSTHTP